MTPSTEWPQEQNDTSLRGGWPGFGDREGFFSSPVFQGPGLDCEAAGTQSRSLGGRVPCGLSAAHGWPSQGRQSGGGVGGAAWSWRCSEPRPAVRQ